MIRRPNAALRTLASTWTTACLCLLLALAGCDGATGDAAGTPDSGVDVAGGSEDASDPVEDTGPGADVDAASSAADAGPGSDADDGTIIDATSGSDAATDATLDVAEPDVPDGVFFEPELEAAPGWFYQVHIPAVPLDDSGESAELYVDLPEGTESVFVMVGGEDRAFFTLMKAITPPPLNKSVVKGAGDHICIPCANRVVSAQQVASFLLPNDPEIEVKGGPWVLKVHATEVVKWFGETSWIDHEGVCDVIVLARTAAPPEAGTLSLHLHFTGSDGLTAESAPDDERLQSGLDQLIALYAQVGLTVDVAGYHDVPGVEEDPTLTQIGSTLGVPNDLGALFLAGQDADATALNVFFVESIFKDVDYEQIGGLVLGVSGGVPGPAFLGPTFRSGVAIATFDLEGRADFFGNVMAHEIGHYLGLFHSTEKDAIFHDTLVDTAEDDASNLMYWAWSPESVTFSDDQAWILRSHPLVQPAPSR